MRFYHGPRGKSSPLLAHSIEKFSCPMPARARRAAGVFFARDLEVLTYAVPWPK